MSKRTDLEAAREALTRLCDKILRDKANDAATRLLIEDAAARLSSAHFYVVACGEFSRGKSTLFSALAGQRQIFPHEPTDTTSIVTTLAWGPVSEAVITMGGVAGAPPHQLTVPVSTVRPYVSSVAANADGQCVLVVELRAPLDPLKSGMVLVDTPGVNSRNEAHNIATRQYLKRADAIVFVASADEPLSAAELAVLCEASTYCPQIEVVLAKADLGGAADLAASASERVSKKLGRPVDVLPVSAVMALDAKDDHLPGLEADSQIPALARRLAVAQDRHDARTALAVTPAVVRAITLLAEPGLRELAVLREAANTDDAFARETARLEREIKTLDAATAHFHADLAKEINGGIAVIRKDVRRACGDLTSRVHADQAMNKPSTRPDAYVNGILSSLADIANTADARRRELFNRVIEAAQQLTEAGFAPSPEADSLRNALRLSAAELSVGDRPGFSFAAVREGLAAGARVAVASGPVGGLIGGVVAAAPGAAAGATVGALVGHMVGWIAGTRDAIQRAQQDWYAANMHSMTQLALGWISRAADDMDYSIEQSAKPTIERLRADFDVSVRNRRDRLSDLLHSAKSNELDRASRQSRMSAIAKQIEGYERLSQELNEIVGTLERLAGSSGVTTNAP